MNEFIFCILYKLLHPAPLINITRVELFKYPKVKAQVRFGDPNFIEIFMVIMSKYSIYFLCQCDFHETSKNQLKFF